MLKATLLESKPNILLKQKEPSKRKQSFKKYRESLHPKDIALALDAMNFRGKSLDEVDIYNLIEYLLTSKKEA